MSDESSLFLINRFSYERKQQRERADSLSAGNAFLRTPTHQLACYLVKQFPFR